MTHTSIVVRAVWDDEGKVWVATSDDLPGLVTEAATVEGLRAKITVMAAELIELNGGTFELPEIPIHIFTEQTARIANPHRSAI